MGWQRQEVGPEAVDGPILGFAWSVPLFDRKESFRFLALPELWQVARDNPLALIGRSLDEPRGFALPELRFRDGSFVLGGGP